MWIRYFGGIVQSSHSKGQGHGAFRTLMRADSVPSPETES